MPLDAQRRLAHDWFDGSVPECVDVSDEAYLESAFSFTSCLATRPHAIRIARGAHVYSASIFDIGEHGTVEIGECSMLNGVRLMCDLQIVIGAFATISWNVMFMDSYRVPIDPDLRRAQLLGKRPPARIGGPDIPAAPIRLHDNVWIGFDVCVLPGVTIGEGSVVGARSVVTSDVPAYMVVAGNPARPIRELPRPTETITP